MSPIKSLKVFVDSVRSLGVRETIASIPAYLREVHAERQDGFDRQYGTRTSDRLLGANENRGHWPTPARVFADMVAKLPVRKEDFTFVDIGSGMGRVLLLASNQPFKKIIGVELDPALVAISRENLATYKAPGKRCADIEARQADATKLDIPAGPVVFYLFRPFTTNILEQVMANIHASALQSPRPMFIIDYNPWPDGPLDKAPWLERVAHVKASGANRFDWTIHAVR